MVEKKKKFATSIGAAIFLVIVAVVIGSRFLVVAGDLGPVLASPNSLGQGSTVVEETGVVASVEVKTQIEAVMGGYSDTKTLGQVMSDDCGSHCLSGFASITADVFPSFASPRPDQPLSEQWPKNSAGDGIKRPPKTTPHQT